MLSRWRAPRRPEHTRKRSESACQNSSQKNDCLVTCLLFFRSRQPNRKKGPQNDLPEPLRDSPGLRVALGAFQARFWTPKGGPNGTQNPSKIHRGAQGPPKSAEEPPGGPKRPPPEARIRGPPRPTSTRKSYTKILVKRSFQTALRKIHKRSLAQWPVLGAQPLWRSGH